MDAHPTSVEATADRLRETREALGKKPSEICRLAGIAPNQYSQWESAHHRPQLEAAFKLCDSLGLTLDWIYRGVLAGVRGDVIEKIQTHRSANRTNERPFRQVS